MKIDFNDVASQWRSIEGGALPDVLDILRNGPYILGKKVLELETKFTQATWSPYALGVSSGTDALRLAMQVVLGDDVNPVVLIQANSHVSGALAAEDRADKTYFIDCDEYYNVDIDRLDRWSGYEFILLVTHMYGQAGNVRELMQRYPSAIVIEDCSQAFGASSQGKPVGSFGTIGAFSLYPTKNLGAIGDAGMIVTNNQEYYERLKLLRQYGLKDKSDCVDLGWNCRLDELQAAILIHKMGMVQGWIAEKRRIAAKYMEILGNMEEIVLPKQAPYADEHTWHIFAIRAQDRDGLKVHLAERGIPTLIHYPVTLNNMTVFKRLTRDKCPRAEKCANELLSLPIHPFMTMEQVQYVCEGIKDFYAHG